AADRWGTGLRPISLGPLDPRNGKHDGCRLRTICRVESSGSRAAGHAYPRPDREARVAADPLQLAVLDETLHLHAALAAGHELLHGGVVDVEYVEVAMALEGCGDLVPPDVGGAAAVVDHDDLSGPA